MTLSEMKAQMIVWLDLMKFKRPDWDRYFEISEVDRSVETGLNEKSMGILTPTRSVFHLFTEKCHYLVSFSCKNENGYLGCIASQRMPRAGETWTRGNDLFDGPFCHETWTRILGDIVSYELVSAVKDFEGGNTGGEPKCSPVYDETKGPVAPHPFSDPISVNSDQKTIGRSN